MALRVRLSRFGRIHRPYYRIVAIDGRCHREGKANEIIGSYDPALPDGKAIQVQMDRVEAWAKEGAQVSVALINLFQHHGLAMPAVLTTLKTVSPNSKPKKVYKPGEKQPWSKPTRHALRKHAAKLKAARKVKTAEATAAHVAAKAAAKPAAEAAPATT